MNVLPVELKGQTGGAYIAGSSLTRLPVSLNELKGQTGGAHKTGSSLTRLSVSLNELKGTDRRRAQNRQQPFKKSGIRNTGYFTEVPSHRKGNRQDMEQETMQKDYRSYDYKEVTVKEEQTSFYIDCYKSLGWVTDENRPLQTERGQSHIWLKRDRRLTNKVELTRLQRNFEDCIAQMEEMKKSTGKLPGVLALSCGILGTVFMAGSVFAVTAKPPIIWLTVLLAVPGFLGWILPYFIYRKSLAKQTEKVTPFIAAKQDEIDEICKKGFSLL